MVSVIIPTYNGEATIGRAINSVLNQGVEVEILVCDDYSTDKTVLIAQSYSNVRVLMNFEHTGGPNAGRNLGLEYAKGEYVAFLDQDDEWLLCKLKKQLSEIENGAELVSSSSIIRVA